MFRIRRKRGHDLNFDYDDKMASYSRRGTWIMRSLVAVAVVLGFGVALVYAYNKGKRESSPPIITAGTGPIKVRPKDPGGMVIRDQDKEIFHREEMGSQLATVEPLIPATTEATEKPERSQIAEDRETSSSPAPVETAESAEAQERQEITEATPREPETSRVAEAPLPEKPEPESVAETPVTEKPEPARIAAAQDEGAGEGQQPVETVQVAKTPPPVLKTPSAEGYRQARVRQVSDRTAKTAGAPKPSSAPVRQVRTASRLRPVPGSYIVQIASLESETAVRKNWRSLQRRYPGVLGNFSLTIQKKTMKDTRKTYYRMRAGPPTTRAVALKLCRELRQRNLGCRIVPL